MSTTLISLVGTEDIPINRPIVIIGRQADCDVVISSKKISRQHCCLASLQDKLIIRDLGSTNGVRVNGRRQEEAVLVSGDELTIGNLRYRVDSKTYVGKSHQPKGKRPPTDEEIEAAEAPIVLEEDDEDEGFGTELADPDAAPRYGLKPVDNDSSWYKVPDDVQLDSSDDDVFRNR